MSTADLKIDHRPGEGPTVVFLHAGVADRRSWEPVARELSEFDVIAYDRRGFGETPASDEEGFSHLDDLFAVLDDVGATTPVWLVGSSMGGALALDAALIRPERVAGLVLIAPAISGAPDPPDDEYDEATQRLGAAMETAEDDGDLDELNRLEAWLWLDGPAGPEGRVTGAARELALDMNAIALHSGAAEDAGASGVDAWRRLEELTVPVTVAWGDLDVPMVITRSRQAAERIPDVRATHVFAGTAHLPYLERPAEVADLVRSAVSG